MPADRAQDTEAIRAARLFENEIALLRLRAEAGRLVAFKTNFDRLPPVAQEALYGIAGELEEIADVLERFAAQGETEQTP